MKNIIFVNKDKEKRAADIYLILTGKRPLEKSSAEHIEYQRERFTELLKEQGVDIKKEEEALLAIYKILGGSVRTVEQQQKAEEAKSKKKKSFAREEKSDEKVDDDDDN